MAVRLKIRHGRACPRHPRLAWIATVEAWMPGTSQDKPGHDEKIVIPVRSNPESRCCGARFPDAQLRIGRGVCAVGAAAVCSRLEVKPPMRWNRLCRSARHHAMWNRAAHARDGTLHPGNSSRES
jgi:hypothetical protein